MPARWDRGRVSAVSWRPLGGTSRPPAEAAVEGAEDGGGGAAWFEFVVGGLDDGFEGVERQGSALEVGHGAIVTDPGCDVGSGGPGEEVEEVFGAVRAEVVEGVGGEFGGQGVVVLAQGEEAGEEGAV